MAPPAPESPAEPPAPMALVPLETARLRLRAFHPDDAPALAAYRNDPAVAHYQSWSLPYPLSRAEELIARYTGDLAPGSWTQLAVCPRDAPGTLIGDVAVRLEDGGHRGELGYTIVPAWHGRGYATEAAGAVLDRLVDDAGLHRIEVLMHPENVASARVAERLGCTYEGTSRESFREVDGWSDDARYAILAGERRAWRVRETAPVGSLRAVRLGPGEGAAADVARFRALRPHRTAEVAAGGTVDALLVDAAYPTEGAASTLAVWGIEADGVPAALALVADSGVVRLLVDRQFDGRGVDLASVAAAIGGWRSA